MNISFEKAYPLVGATIAASLTALDIGDFSSAIALNALDLQNGFAGLFGWASLQTTMLFGIYSYFLGRKTGFVGKIKSTTQFKGFLGYQHTAMLVGFIAAIAGLAGMTIDQTSYNEFAIQNYSIRFFILIVFIFIFTYVFFLFLRVALIFRAILKFD